MAEVIGLRAVIDMRQFNKGLSSYNKGIGQMNKKTSGFVSSASGKFAKLGGGILKFGAIAGGVALAGVGALAIGVGGLGVASVNTAISFESAFAGVLKTTDGLTSSIGVLNEEGEKLRQGFVDLSKEVPLAFEELAAIGELGGQLGIGKEALLDFTETITALGVSTNLTTEEAATAIARLGNIYQVTSEDMGENTQRIGSTIVALGNNFATTERDIVAFGERLAGAGKIAGLSQAEILGIGAAMSSVGVQAEAGGTATQKVLLAMNNAVFATADGFVDNSEAVDKNIKKLTKLQAESARLEAQFPGLQAELLAQKDAFIVGGGAAEDFGRQLGDKTRQKAFETATAIQELSAETQLLRDQQGQPVDPGQLAKFAKVAGISADEFKEAWQEDAAGAFQMFVEGLGGLGDEAAGALDDLGLADQRLIRSFLSLAGAGDLLGDAMDTANTAFEENTALATEAAQRYATTESQIAILKNTFRAIGDSIGSRFLPILNRLISVGKNLVEKFAGPIAAIIENTVVPAIDNFIGSIQNLITEFQKGGLFGGGAGSFGGAGLLAAIGISPKIIGTVEGIFNGIQQIISGFLEGGIIGALGGAGAGGGVSTILAALGLSEDAITEVENFLLKIKGAIFGFITSITFGGTTGQGASAFLRAFGLDESVLDVVQTVIDGIIGIVQQLPMFFSQAFAFVVENIEIFKGALFGIGGVLLGGAVLGAIGVVASAIFALFTPINLIIAAAALLGAAWAGNWFNIQGITAQVITAIMNLFNTAFPIIQAVVMTAGAVISSIFAGIMAVIVGQVVPNLQAAFTNITAALASLGISWSDVWDAVLIAIGIVAAAIGAILLALVATVTGIIAGLSSVILVFSQGIQNMATFIEQILTGAIQFVIGFQQFWTSIFAGDLPAALEGFKLAMSGVGNFISGVFGAIFTAIVTPLAAILTFLGTFVASVIDFFATLSSTLVGNSIIPDMITAIIDTFLGMVQPILDVFSTLSEGIATVLGAIFGGGGEETQAPTIAFDPAEMLAGMEQVNIAIAGVDLALTNISTITLLLLQESFLITTTMMIEQLILLLQTGIMPVDLALVIMTTVTLPNLQAMAIAVAAAIIAAFIPVQALLEILVGLVNELAEGFLTVAQAAKEASKAMIKGFAEAKSIIKDLIKVVFEAVIAFEKMAAAAKKAAAATKKAGKASGVAGGLGFQKGIGFQAGTLSNVGGLLGLGAKVPPGFPNDSFGPLFVQSGEEMLITPQGTSIENVVFARLAELLRGTSVQGGRVTNNTTNIEMNMNIQTGSSARANIQQFEVMRGLIGA